MDIWKHAATSAQAIVIMAAASAAHAETIDVDVGAAKPVVVDKATPLKLALFIEIGTNSAVQSTIQGVRDNSAR